MIGVGLVIVWMPGACRAIMLRRGCGGLKHITVKSLWVQEVVREDSIEIERISRGEMHAHILASLSSAEELVTMSRSFEWDNDTCRPVLDRAQILTGDVNWDEFHALLFVPCCLLTELAETSMNRNLIKWYVRCVSFWTDCDELIQVSLNNVLEAEDSEDLPLCVEFRRGVPKALCWRMFEFSSLI